MACCFCTCSSERPDRAQKAVRALERRKSVRRMYMVSSSYLEAAQGAQKSDFGLLLSGPLSDAICPDRIKAQILAAVDRNGTQWAVVGCAVFAEVRAMQPLLDPACHDGHLTIHTKHHAHPAASGRSSACGLAVRSPQGDTRYNYCILVSTCTPVGRGH